ncbi:helix-turn-helix transcriptional regulator [Spirosoma arcticum]
MPMNLTQRDYLRPKEVQTLLGIGNTKFWNLVKQGYIAIIKPEGPTSKLVYVKRTDIDRFMSGKTTN